MTSFLLKQALTNPVVTQGQNIAENNWQKTSTFSKFSNILTNPLRTYFEETKEVKSDIKH